MTTAPRGGFDSGGGGVVGGNGSISGLCAAAQSSMADPSILFDLDDFMMATDYGNSCNSNDMLPPSLVSIHAPIKEEPEFDNDDHRYLHSPIGLPIPRRNNHPQQNGTGGGSVGGSSGVGSTGVRSSSKIQGADVLLSPTTTMWGPACPTPTQRINVPFPATPFNTPSQGLSMAQAPDFRSLFLTSSDSLAIKEELPDIEDTDLESVTMKAVSMFPMEEDDIFLVDKADLIGFSQGPTLAELNASEESLLNDLNFDDFIMPPHQQQQQALHQQQQQQQQQQALNPIQCSTGLGGNLGILRNKSFSSVLSDNVDPDRFRMNDLNAAFAASPSLSSFELLRTRNLGIPPDDECLSQLSSTQMGFDLEQLQTVVMTDVTSIPSLATAMEVTTTPTSLLSASLPANIGGTTGGGNQLSKLTRRTEEGGRVKPPPPYPTSPPQKSNSSALQELLSLKSPGGRLPSPNPGTGVGRHSPSPTANTASSLQRPTHLTGGARQRTVSHTAASSPSPAGPSGTAGTPGSAQAIPKSPSLAATNPLLLARLSSSAPAPSLLSGGSSLAESTTNPSAWQRREPRNRLLSTSSLVEVGEVHGSTSSISTVGVGGILSPGSFDFSHDEGFDSEEDSDHYEDFDDSDSDSGGSDDEGGRGEPRASGSGSSKKERFFWQYNVQAKGPKGQKINLTPETVDPHVLNEVQDPVFSPYCSVDGIKHSGKARRGDGNDLTPNPRKLHSIGRELDKLNRLINDMTPVSELPMAVRPKSRKEKNKLASRACRLKKKAQHEANKVKLYGLEQEHRKLMNGLLQAKSIVASKFESMTAQQPHADATARLERVFKASTIKIAGHSTEFVNKVLERVKGGEPSGGLNEI